MPIGDPESTIPCCECPTCRLVMQKVQEAIAGIGSEGRAGLVTVRVSFSAYKPGPEWTLHSANGTDVPPEKRMPIIHVGQAE